jgi:hypothetical protein
MLLAAPGGRSMYGPWRAPMSVTATTRVIALLAALILPAFQQAARADEDASAAASTVIASLPRDLGPGRCL